MEVTAPIVPLVCAHMIQMEMVYRILEISAPIPRLKHQLTPTDAQTVRRIQMETGFLMIRICVPTP